MATRKWDVQEAEKLAQQLPRNMEDAWAVVECLVEIVERASDAEVDELLPGFCTTLQ